MSQDFRRFVGIGFLAAAIAGAAIASSAAMPVGAQQSNERKGSAAAQDPVVKHRAGEGAKLDHVG